MKYNFTSDLLNTIEDIYMFKKKGLIQNKTIDEGFGIVIIKTFENESIKSFIKQIQIFYDDYDVYTGLEKLYRIVKKYQKGK